ncbi:MAG: heavy-metal-associated domain-containing protein [Pseudomonadota bacterium]|nr:heavy-metal-associated domain-containing protein [Pseudomonadota bacterium]
METLTLGIGGMQCGASAAEVERRLYAAPGVQSAAVSLVGAEAEITFDPRLTGADALAKVIADAGYAVRITSEQ